jgi:hypothetical protein
MEGAAGRRTTVFLRRGGAVDSGTHRLGVGRSAWSPPMVWSRWLAGRIGADARFSPEWSETSSSFASQMRLGYTSSLPSTERIKSQPLTSGPIAPIMVGCRPPRSRKGGPVETSPPGRETTGECHFRIGANLQTEVAAGILVLLSTRVVPLLGWVVPDRRIEHVFSEGET